ncbi:hypothetical protein [Actinobacillus succinogenes]|uniref:hypothetical protein n=1 Tax=Actinobacillus succinogenes TaxID=67854 RepID=UPI00359C107C
MRYDEDQKNSDHRSHRIGGLRHSLIDEKIITCAGIKSASATFAAANYDKVFISGEIKR